jgi:[acyl-carrier-protein] S-malonyltransferase
MKKILMFSGQNTQFVGMGKELFQHSKLIFEEADHILGRKLTKLMFDGDFVKKII